MKEIIAFLSPADKVRFENEVPHPTVVCDTFEDFKKEIESRDEGYVIKKCMLIFSQDISAVHYDELMRLIDEHNHFVFRMLNTIADSSYDEKGYEAIADVQDSFILKINVVNDIYLPKGVNGEFTGALYLRLERSDFSHRDPLHSIGTYLTSRDYNHNS